MLCNVGITLSTKGSNKIVLCLHGLGGQCLCILTSCTHTTSVRRKMPVSSRANRTQEAILRSRTLICLVTMSKIFKYSAIVEQMFVYDKSRSYEKQRLTSECHMFGHKLKWPTILLRRYIIFCLYIQHIVFLVKETLRLNVFFSKKFYGGGSKVH